MAKTKIFLEHVLRSKSRNTIWNMVGTPAGLAKWFADDVERQNNILTFRWGKHEERTARIKHCTEGVSLKFHWNDDDASNTYVELRLEQDELTRDFVLAITDFADEDEADELADLWESQLETLFRSSGI